MVKATNCLARRAFDIGAEWSYRLNDDSWLQTPNWGTELTTVLSERSHRVIPLLNFTNANTSVNSTGMQVTRARGLHELEQQLPIVGVVGPFCPDGKQWTEGGHVLLVMDLVRPVCCASIIYVCTHNSLEKRANVVL